MTLTPAIKEAYDRVDSYVRNDPCFKYGSGHLCFKEDLDALLSVVAAEEGRKYEALAELVKEWQEAVKEEAALWLRAKDVPIEYEVVDVWLRAFDRKEAALSALAQWEAPTRCTCDDTSLASSYQRCPIDSHNAEGL